MNGCRVCGNPNLEAFIDLGTAPISNNLLSYDETLQNEIFYPLKVVICKSCFVCQTLTNFAPEDIFHQNYTYFSSFSSSWLNHARNFCKQIHKQLNLKSDNFVIEIASNDGYLLKNFVEMEIPCLGIEPTTSTANEAKRNGIPTKEMFFNAENAHLIVEEHHQADLVVANNVIAHIEDVNDFAEGLKIILAEEGTISCEFAYLTSLISQKQFDTVYHEHYYYHSLIGISYIFDKAGLKVYSVEKLDTHGGSLRVYATHRENTNLITDKSVGNLLKEEEQLGLKTSEYYKNFQSRIDRVKNELLSFLIETKNKNQKVIAYGAASKGITFLNYAGIKSDLISYVVDKNPSKKEKYVPGCHIPIVDEVLLKNEKPDFILILPWNIKNEIMDQLDYIKDWDGKFVVAVPDLTII